MYKSNIVEERATANLVPTAGLKLSTIAVVVVKVLAAVITNCDKTIPDSSLILICISGMFLKGKLHANLAIPELSNFAATTTFSAVIGFSLYRAEINLVPSHM